MRTSSNNCFISLWLCFTISNGQYCACLLESLWSVQNLGEIQLRGLCRESPVIAVVMVIAIISIVPHLLFAALSSHLFLLKQCQSFYMLGCWWQILKPHLLYVLMLSKENLNMNSVHKASMSTKEEKYLFKYSLQVLPHGKDYVAVLSHWNYRSKGKKTWSFKWVCPKHSLVSMYKRGHTIERQITNLGFHGQEGKVPMNILGDILREKRPSFRRLI